jgi:hypothetical protein
VPSNTTKFINFVVFAAPDLLLSTFLYWMPTAFDSDTSLTPVTFVMKKREDKREERKVFYLTTLSITKNIMHR